MVGNVGAAVPWHSVALGLCLNLQRIARKPPETFEVLRVFDAEFTIKRRVLLNNERRCYK